MLRALLASPTRSPQLMQPKSLLRLPQAASRLDDLVNGRFTSVIDDQTIGDRRDEVQRVVFCTGKLFYDLNAKERPSNVAIARVEELYPWPAEQVSRVVDLYRNVTEVVWAQEEPKNMTERPTAHQGRLRFARRYPSIPLDRRVRRIPSMPT